MTGIEEAAASYLIDKGAGAVRKKIWGTDERFSSVK